MLLAVILFVLGGGTETEVRADVEHAHAGFHQRDGVFGGESVRKREERGVAFGGDPRNVRRGESQIESVKTREDLGNVLPRILTGGNDAELHIGMSGEKTDQLFARITGRADNCNTHFRHVLFSSI